MTREKKIKKNMIIEKRMRKRKERRFLCMLTLCFLLAVICGTLKFTAIDAKADEPIRYKYYASVYIDRGDTLWGISEEYITEEYASIEEHIDEIRSINHIYGDKIEYGKVISVPYYSDEYK